MGSLPTAALLRPHPAPPARRAAPGVRVRARAGLEWTDASARAAGRPAMRLRGLRRFYTAPLTRFASRAVAGCSWRAPDHAGAGTGVRLGVLAGSPAPVTVKPM